MEGNIIVTQGAEFVHEDGTSVCLIATVIRDILEVANLKAIPPGSFKLHGNLAQGLFVRVTVTNELRKVVRLWIEGRVIVKEYQLNVPLISGHVLKREAGEELLKQLHTASYSPAKILSSQTGRALSADEFDQMRFSPTSASFNIPPELQGENVQFRFSLNIQAGSQDS